jgi:hypothetical protein
VDGTRTAERVKRLRIEPVDDTLVRFHASLDDVSHGAEGVETIHSISIAGTISLPDLVIRSAEAHTDYQPWDECKRSLAPVRALVGAHIGPGFRAHVLEAMGRTRGCTHYLSLALDLAASHTLSLFLRMRSKHAFEGRSEPDGAWIGEGLKLEPRLENACIAMTSDSQVIRRAKRHL